MIEKNKFYTVNIIRSGENGEGIAQVDDMVVFVPFAIVGEVVEILVLCVKKRYAFAKISRIIKPSPMRKEPFCPVFFKCGGCDMQHVDYGEQLKIKAQNVVGLFHKTAGLDVKVEVVPSPALTGYRNKLSAPIGCDKTGKLFAGFFAPDSHRIVKFEFCPLHGKTVNGLLQKAVEFFNEKKLTAYDEQTGKGYLRHVVVRELGEGVSVTVVVNSKDVRPLDGLYGFLVPISQKPLSVFANINCKRNNVITGDEFVRLQGNTPQGEMCGIKFSLHPASFLQVNLPLAERIYSDAVSLMKKGGTVIDAFSGIGVTSNIFAKNGSEVVAVEIVPEAVKDADELKKKNGNENSITNVCGDCAVEVPKIAEKLKSQGKKDISVFLDPPRKGCDERVLQAIASAKAERIVYMSCNPSTLARDVKFLVANGYELATLKCYDLFPHTKHVESLALLVKKQN